MTGYDTVLFTMKRGDTREARITVTDQAGVAISITDIAQFYFTAKQKLSDADAAAVIRLTSLAGQGLTVVDAVNGLVDLKIPASQTLSLLSKPYKLFADFQGRLTSGEIKTITTGLVVVVADATIGTT